MISSKLLVILVAATLAAAGGEVKFCTEENMTGHCDTLSFKNNDCINFESDLQDNVESLDPVGGGHSCILYKDFNCDGDKMGFTKHHNSLGDFANEGSSFKCTS